MFGKEVEPEDEGRMIEKFAKWVERHGMEVPAIFILETFKPLVFIGGEFGRFFLAPFILLVGQRADTFISTFEKKKNIETLLKMIEEKADERPMKKGSEKAKRGLRRFWPFR